MYTVTVQTVCRCVSFRHSQDVIHIADSIKNKIIGLTMQYMECMELASLAKNIYKERESAVWPQVLYVFDRIYLWKMSWPDHVCVWQSQETREKFLTKIATRKLLAATSHSWPQPSAQVKSIYRRNGLGSHSSQHVHSQDCSDVSGVLMLIWRLAAMLALLPLHLKRTP